MFSSRLIEDGTLTKQQFDLINGCHGIISLTSHISYSLVEQLQLSINSMDKESCLRFDEDR